MRDDVLLRPPRHAWVPAYVSSAGEEAVDLCRHYGLDLDPEQELVLAAALGERPDGKWAAKEVGLCAPRQNGKGVIVEARILTGMYLLEEGLQTYSAHLFDTSLELFERLRARIEDNPDLERRVARVSHAHGKEGITLKGGQRVRFRARTKSGGRGFTGDVIYLDEAMDLPESAQASLVPTLSARSVFGNPQVWYVGSAVDQLVHDNGLVFARARARGLANDEALAWFEWSASFGTLDELVRPPDGHDPMLDEAEWERANPALDRRIAREFVRSVEFKGLGRRAFAVERLGVGDWPDVDGLNDNGIDLVVWDRLVDKDSTLVGAPMFAIDVDPEQRNAAIGAAGRRHDRRQHIEVVDHRPGTGWIVDRCVELKARWRPAGFVCDAVSPAASLIPELEQRGVKVKALSSDEHAQAYGAFVNSVANDRIRHRGQEPLRSAIKGAARRRLGDRHAWARRASSADITPLVAVTLAGWAASKAKRRGAVSF